MNSVWIVYAEVYEEVTFGETIDDALLAVRALERTPVHVGIKRQTCIRQHTSAYVSIHQHTSNGRPKRMFLRSVARAKSGV